MRTIDQVTDRIEYSPTASGPPGLDPATSAPVPGPGSRPGHIATGFAWTLVFAYLLAELVTATAWKTPYSFRHDTISDLGITTCTPHACSPLHLLMNATFVALGSVTIAGAVVFRTYIPHGPRQWSIVALAVIIGLSANRSRACPKRDTAVSPIRHLIVLRPRTYRA